MFSTSKIISEVFNWKRQGKDMAVNSVRSIASAKAGALVFLSSDNADAIEILNKIENITCITTPKISDRLNCSVIVHENPRLAFCQAVNFFYVEKPQAVISKNTTISADAKIGEGVSIGSGSVIGQDVYIGENSKIHSQVVIAPQSIIGKNCIIKSNTTIGESGFGFVMDESGVPVAFPHLGHVEIGNNVEIGANCTVVKGALDKTIIGDNVKTDDHVHIAHNCKIGANTLIAAGAVISGSAVIEKNVWIGPNATVGDYINIGEHARIAIGSVILRDVESGAVMIGNPAKSAVRKTT